MKYISYGHITVRAIPYLQCNQDSSQDQKVGEVKQLRQFKSLSEWLHRDQIMQKLRSMSYKWSRPKTGGQESIAGMVRIVTLWCTVYLYRLYGG